MIDSELVRDVVAQARAGVPCCVNTCFMYVAQRIREDVEKWAQIEGLSTARAGNDLFVGGVLVRFTCPTLANRDTFGFRGRKFWNNSLDTDHP